MSLIQITNHLLLNRKINFFVSISIFVAYVTIMAILLFQNYSKDDANNYFEKIFVFAMSGTFLMYAIFLISKAAIERTKILESLILVTYLLSGTAINYAIDFKSSGVLNVNGMKIFHTGFAGLYLSIMTITSVGYGDYVPADDFGRSLAMTEALLGHFLMALMIALILKSLISSNT